ncbi:MAG: hypothetical protein N3A63_06935 [Bacteroidetes bacterium]|nr:hypothetical protein [Bacteroidota bacterium]
MKHPFIRCGILVVWFLNSSTTILLAQLPSQPDTTYVFTPSRNLFDRSSEFRPYTTGWGIDLMLSDNGFGLGGFYRSDINKEWAWSISLAISGAKDPTEVEQYDYYYGDTYVLGKKNRLLMFPLHVVLYHRLFREYIVDSFRPFLHGGLGPTMMYVFPYSKRSIVYDPWSGGNIPVTEKTEFFSSLKYGKMHTTLGGFLGVGAYFSVGKNTITGISVRYYFAYFPRGIEVMDNGLTYDFGGIALLVQFGSLY